MKVLLGSGNAYREGWCNVDYYNKPYDIKHDLNKYPYPFEDNEIDELHAIHLLEHLNDPIKFLNEVHRICKPNAKIIIEVPHWSSSGAWNNPTHKRAFGISSMNYFKEGYPEKYSDKLFEVEIEIRAIGQTIWNLNKTTKYLWELWFCYFTPYYKNIRFKMKPIKRSDLK